MPAEPGPASPEQILRDQYEYEPPTDDLSIAEGHAPLNMPGGETPPGPQRNASGQFVAGGDTLSQQSSHPARLVADAARFGVENPEGLTTPQLIEAVRDAKLDFVVAERAAGERSAVADAIGRTPSANGSQSPGTVAPADASAAADSQIDWGEGEAGTKLTENDWPTAARNAFKQAAQVPALLKRLEALEAGWGEQQREKFVSAVDQGFADAGPAFAKIVGKGVGKDMDTASPEYGVRMAVLASLKANPPPKGSTPAKAIAERTKQLFSHLAAQDGSEPAAPSRQPPPRAPSRVTPDQWAQANTAVPNGRQPPPGPKGAKAAVAAVADYLRTHDLGAGEADPEMPD